MARKVQTFTGTYGRDEGKKFILTEMAADAAEWWAIRAGRALAISGVQLPEDWENAGMAQMAVLGLAALANLPESTLKALLDEMFECVKYQPALEKIPPQPLNTGPGSQIEEVKTRWQLRQALWYLHLGFSTPADAPITTASPSPTSAG